MNKLQYFKSILFLTILFINGCASSPAKFQEAKEAVINKEKIINKPFDVVWQKTVEWFAVHNTPIKTIDLSSGLIASDYNLSVDDNTDYIDCGKPIYGNIGTWGTEVTTPTFTNQKGNINVLIYKINDTTTKITINFFAESYLTQYDDKGIAVSNQKVNCYSKGTLEKEIFDSITN